MQQNSAIHQVLYCLLLRNTKISKYDKKIPQSHTTNVERNPEH